MPTYHSLEGGQAKGWPLTSESQCAVPGVAGSYPACPRFTLVQDKTIRPDGVAVEACFHPQGRGSPGGRLTGCPRKEE